MAKLTLNDIVNLESESTVIQTINGNNQAVEDAVQNTLSLDGTAPNAMGAVLDMNSNRIINLPVPASDTDAARRVDLTGLLNITNETVPALSGNTGKFLSNNGTILVWTAIASSSFLTPANNLSDVSSPSVSRGNLGLGTGATVNTGTSGATVPLLNTTNTWSALQTWNTGGQYTGTTELRLTYTGLTTLSGDSAGFRGAPINSQNSAYTLVLDDAGRSILDSSGSAVAYTIPPNSSVPFPLGTTIVICNTGSSILSIMRGAGVTMTLAASTSNADRTMAQNGLATLFKSGTNTWILSGSGLT